MFESTYIPIIISAMLTPNPAEVGETVLISIAAADLKIVPREELFYAGEFTCGEV